MMDAFARDVDFRARPRRSGKATSRLADVLVKPPRPEPRDGGSPLDPTPPPPADSAADQRPPDAAEPLAPDALELVFDEAVLPSMLAAAAAEARAAVLVELRDDKAARVVEAEAAIALALRDAVEARNAGIARDASLILALAEAIARRAVPRALAVTPLDDLRDALPELLARLDHPPAVDIVVAADQADALDEAILPLVAEAGFDGTIRIVGDATLAPGDAVVRWPEGEARHAPDAMIDRALALCAGWLAEREAATAAPDDRDSQEAPHEH